MRWFRSAPRPVAPAAPEPAIPAPLPGQCMESGCGGAEGYPCAYVDHQNARCPAHFCADHIGSLSPDGGLCRRHKLVAAALAATAGSILEVMRPDLDDRSFGLLLHLVENLNAPMLALLADRHGGEDGVGVAADTSVRGIRRGSEVAWESGWSAYTATGMLARVSLRVPTSQPPAVQVLVDRQVVLEGVPNWITRRLAGQPPSSGDTPDYLSGVLKATEQALDKES